MNKQHRPELGGHYMTHVMQGAVVTLTATRQRIDAHSRGSAACVDLFMRARPVLRVTEAARLVHLVGTIYTTRYR